MYSPLTIYCYCDQTHALQEMKNLFLGWLIKQQFKCGVSQSFLSLTLSFKTHHISSSHLICFCLIRDNCTRNLIGSYLIVILIVNGGQYKFNYGPTFHDPKSTSGLWLLLLMQKGREPISSVFAEDSSLNHYYFLEKDVGKS